MLFKELMVPYYASQYLIDWSWTSQNFFVRIIFSTVMSALTSAVAKCRPPLFLSADMARVLAV